MVLAVDVGSNAAAECGKFGAWGHGREKTTRYREADDILDGRTCLDAQQTLVLIKLEQVLEGKRGDDVIMQAGVSVGTATALGQDRYPFGGAKVTGIVGASQRGVDSGVEAPARCSGIFCQ